MGPRSCIWVHCEYIDSPQPSVKFINCAQTSFKELRTPWLKRTKCDLLLSCISYSYLVINFFLTAIYFIVQLLCFSHDPILRILFLVPKIGSRRSDGPISRFRFCGENVGRSFVVRSHDPIFRTNKESSIWRRNDHKDIMQNLSAPFIFQEECRRKIEHVLFPSVSSKQRVHMSEGHFQCVHTIWFLEQPNIGSLKTDRVNGPLHKHAMYTGDNTQVWFCDVLRPGNCGGKTSFSFQTKKSSCATLTARDFFGGNFIKIMKTYVNINTTQHCFQGRWLEIGEGLTRCSWQRDLGLFGYCHLPSLVRVCWMTSWVYFSCNGGTNGSLFAGTTLM